jgi:hypothetical protein
MNLDQARVINPVLTEVALGYMQQPLVANVLFPKVPVRTRKGQILQFGREAFRVHDTKRAPGGIIARAQISYSPTPFALIQHALGVQVPIEEQEEAAAVLALDLLNENIQTVADSVRLEIEVTAAQIATNPATFPASNIEALSGTSMLDQSGNPFDLFGDAKETVRSQIGARANTIIVGPKVLTALQKNPLVLDRLKYTSSQVPGLDDLARLFQVDVFVEGAAVSVDEEDNFQDVWGKNIVVAYVAKGSKSRRTPCFAYQYELDKMPVVTDPEFNRKTRSFEAEFLYENGLYVTAAGAGFLIQNAVA